MKGKVTGIGGLFFKVKNPEQTKAWYEKHLGMPTDQYGMTFEWISAKEPEKKGFTQWSPMSDSTDYFKPSEKDFMINYRVENLKELVEELKANGVQVLDEIEEFEYGKFVHILDPDGHSIELWEPKDEVYNSIIQVRVKS